MVLDELVSAIDKVCESDPHTRSSGETVELLHRELSRLEAATTQSVAAFDASREWEASGARNAAAWIARRCNLPGAKAKRRVRLGRALRHMPHAESAWLAGDISDSHVAALESVRSPQTEAAFDRDEEELVREARRFAFSTFTRRLAWWRYRHDADGAEDDAESARDSRELFVSQSWRDMWFGNFTLDPIAGAIVNGELRRIEQEFFEADWAEARARLGDDARGCDLRRTPAQRRADALVEMATRSATMPANGRRPEPLFSIFVGYESFHGMLSRLAGGSAVTPGSLAPWLEKAWVERVVFDGPSRIIDLGAQRRLFTGATRRAIELRDQECFHEFCDLPAGECQIDHIEPWAAGGRTVQANGRPACGFHNRARHHRRM